MITSIKWMLLLLQLCSIQCIMLELEPPHAEFPGKFSSDQISEKSSNVPMALFVKERSSDVGIFEETPVNEPHSSFAVTHVKDDNTGFARNRENIFHREFQSLPAPKRQAPTAFVHSSFGGFRKNLVGREELRSNIVFGEEETTTFQPEVPEQENEIEIPKFVTNLAPGGKKHPSVFQNLSPFQFSGQRPAIQSSGQRVRQRQRVQNNQQTLPLLFESLNIPKPVLVHNFPQVFPIRQNLNQNRGNFKSNDGSIDSPVFKQNDLPLKENKNLESVQQPTHQFVNQNNQFPQVNQIPFSSFSEDIPVKRENTQATLNITPDVKENQIHEQLPPPTPQPLITPSPLNNQGQSFVLRLHPSFVLKNATSFDDLQPHNSFEKAVLLLGEKYKEGLFNEEQNTFTEQPTTPSFDENDIRGKDNIKERDAASQDNPVLVPEQFPEETSQGAIDPFRPSYFGRALVQEESVVIPRGRSLEPGFNDQNTGFVPGDLEGGFVPSNFFGTLNLAQ